jgi:hypothetical protein
MTLGSFFNGVQFLMLHRLFGNEMLECRFRMRGYPTFTLKWPLFHALLSWKRINELHEDLVLLETLGFVVKASVIMDFKTLVFENCCQRNEMWKWNHGPGKWILHHFRVDWDVSNIPFFMTITRSGLQLQPWLVWFWHTEPNKDSSVYLV